MGLVVAAALFFPLAIFLLACPDALVRVLRLHICG
jgi:hypothetical protein